MVQCLHNCGFVLVKSTGLTIIYMNEVQLGCLGGLLLNGLGPVRSPRVA